MTALRLEGVSKVFPGAVRALDDLTLDIARGEFFVLLGPSGSGKTTLLRLLAGLETVSAGRIWIDGRDVTAEPPHLRQVAMVFQHDVLWPQWTVRRNLEGALQRPRASRTPVPFEMNAAGDSVDTLARELGIEPLLERLPESLSGGERQRAALGRALLQGRRLLLLDEPLASLDPPLRGELRSLLRRYHRRHAVTTVFVTHDQGEALALADRVAVLAEGRLRQAAPPVELYSAPADPLVAGFVGSPPMNLVPVSITYVNDRWSVAALGTAFPLDRGALAWTDSDLARCDLLGIRPEHGVFDTEVPALVASAVAGLVLPGKVVDREYAGHDWIAGVQTPWGRVNVRTPNPIPLDETRKLVLPYRHLVGFACGKRIVPPPAP